MLSLTHLPLDKMAAVLADDVFNCIFLNENDRIQIQFSLKYVPRIPIDNKPALVQLMAWRRIGNKPLSEPILIRFNDAYMRHYPLPRNAALICQLQYRCRWLLVIRGHKSVETHGVMQWIIQCGMISITNSVNLYIVVQENIIWDTIHKVAAMLIKEAKSVKYQAHITMTVSV